MKKLFLPLLAAIGMVAGFTLSSCGGGGGSSSGQVDITGLYVTTGSGVPGFAMSVDERLGDSNVYRVTYTFGEATYPGSLAVQIGYPMLNEDGKAVIKSTMGIDSVNVLQDSNFMAWIGGKPDALSIQLDSLINMTLTLDRNTDTGIMRRNVTGVYFVKVDGSMKLPEEVDYDSLYITGQTKIFKKLGKTPTNEGEY